jgi:hypothetical protein
MTRGLRRLVGRWLVLVMVLTQVTVSAYACPSLSQMGLAVQAPQTSSATAAEDGMSMPKPQTPATTDVSQGATLDCSSMQGRLDPAAPNLCHACCHHDQQTDHASSLVAPAVILNSLYAVPAAVLAPTPASFLAQSAGDLAAATPPRTVLHCCWRI